MPIEGPKLPRLSSDDVRELDYQVMGVAFQTHEQLGCMCDELIYENDLSASLMNVDFAADVEVPVRVSHGDFEKIYRIDLIADNRFIYELKTVARLTNEHEAQLINYLLLTNTAHGKLINFRPEKVESRFINAPVSASERMRYEVIKDSMTIDADQLREIVLRLIDDWGMFLDLGLYTEAITFLVGGEDRIVRTIPLSRNGVQLGTQRFRLLNDESAFRVTGFKRDLNSHRYHLQRLLKRTPLKRIHWINFCRNELSLATIERN